MIRTRSARTLATLAVTVSLALTAIAGPVLGAQAVAVFTSTAVMDAVSPEGYIAYDVSFDLAPGETSSLPQLFMNAKTPTGWDLIGIEAGSESRPGTCNTSGADLTCTFGAMAPADPAITMRVVYKVGTSQGDFTVEFKVNTTGVAGDKKKNSHGDDYLASDTIAVTNSGGNYAGSYVQTLDPVADNQNVNKNNPQATKVTPPEINIPVSVGEDNDISACQAVHGNSCFGQASIINVNDGAPYEDGIKVEITYNANKPGIQFIHFFDTPKLDGDGNPTILFEEITDDCIFVNGAPTNAPCKSVTTANGKTFAIVYLLENGKTFGH
jgi:hypothetical protein